MSTVSSRRLTRTRRFSATSAVWGGVFLGAAACGGGGSGGGGADGSGTEGTGGANGSMGTLDGSPSAASTATGSSGGTGGDVGAVSGGGAGGTGGFFTECFDEEGDSPDVAVELEALTDCDEDADVLTGEAGPEDVDYFTFLGTDDLLCSVNPAASSADVSFGLELCMFADCGPGGSTVDCTTGRAESDGDLQGCCADGAGDVELSVACAGSSDDALVFIRVSQPFDDACVPYSVEYHY